MRSAVMPWSLLSFRDSLLFITCVLFCTAAATSSRLSHGKIPSIQMQWPTEYFKYSFPQAIDISQTSPFHPMQTQPLILTRTLHRIGVCLRTLSDLVHRYINPSDVVVSYVVSHFYPPEDGFVVFYLNGQEMGRYTQQANEFGEIRTTVQLPELMDGFYDASISLLRPDDSPTGVEKTVTFQIEASGWDAINAPQPPAPCALSNACREDEHCGGGDLGERGWCSRGTCLCHPDYIGEHCEFYLFNTTHFLPPVDPHRSPSRCQKTRAWEAGAAELMADLYATQNPTTCSPSTTMLFEAPTHGLGTNLHYLGVVLNRAHKEGKAMVMVGNWTYGMQADCKNSVGADGKQDGHLCHFESMGKCSASEMIAQGAAVFERHSPTNPPDSRILPSKFSSQSVLWYRGYLSHFLMRPNWRLEQIVREARNTAGVVSPYIGVQIRRGDSCAHSATSSIRPPCPSVQQFIDAVLLMKSTYNVSNVYLATDDVPSQEAFESMHKRGVINLFMMPLDRSMFDGQWFIEYRIMRGFVNVKQVTESTYQDLFMLRDADYFVGTFASQFSRLAFEMNAAHKGGVVPYISVDYPWCFHFLEPRNIPGYGMKFC